MRINTLICAAAAAFCTLCPAYGYSETSIPDELSLSRRSTMAESELQDFIQKWDVAKQSSLMAGVGNLLGHVMTRMLFPNGEHHLVLKYNNKEIVDRVVDLYIAEWQRYWTLAIQDIEQRLDSTEDRERIAMLETILSLDCQRLAQSIARDGRRFDDAHLDEPSRYKGEAELDYHDLLVDLAESTFTEAIYPYVLSTFQVATMHDYYLSYVRPKDTLHAFLNASVGQWEGVQLNPDFLYLPDAAGTESVNGAMKRLLKMIQNNEEFQASQRDNVVEFVARHVLHFGERDVPPADGMDEALHARGIAAMDYRTRVDGLQILSVLGNADEIPLVRQIAHDPPDPAPATPENPNPASIASITSAIEARLATRIGQ